MKDAFGTELQVGDLILFPIPEYQHGQCMTKGEVVFVREKTVDVRIVELSEVTAELALRSQWKQKLLDQVHCVRKPNRVAKIG